MMETDPNLGFTEILCILILKDDSTNGIDGDELG